MLEYDPILAPCPFCNGPAGFYREAQGNFRDGVAEPVNAWLAGCISNACSVHVDTEGDDSKEGAAAKWNTRIGLIDPTGIINSLQARVHQLEAQLESERKKDLLAQPRVVENTIKRLRLHGVILLQVEQMNDSMRREMRENATLDAAYNQVWVLDQAPLTHTVKEALRAAANSGMSRW